MSSLPRFPRFFSFSCLLFYLSFSPSLTLVGFVCLAASFFVVFCSFLRSLAALRVVAVLVAVLFVQ